MPAPVTTDWTCGPAKWAAVLILGAASIFGMVWSITMRRPLLATIPAPAAPVVEASAARPADPGHVIEREDTDVPAAAAPAAHAPRSRAAGPKPALTARLNVNTATAAELELLPGIGPALAGRIVQDRQANGPFKSVDDLDRVKGIGPKILDRIHELVTVD